MGFIIRTTTQHVVARYLHGWCPFGHGLRQVMPVRRQTPQGGKHTHATGPRQDTDASVQGGLSSESVRFGADRGRPLPCQIQAGHRLHVLIGAK